MTERRQDILVTRDRLGHAIEVPSVANGSHGHWATKNRPKTVLQDATRHALERLAARPRFPCRVEIYRCAPRRLEGDNLARALKAVRDAIARWAHGRPETEPARDKDTRRIIIERGRVKMTRPPPPDGPNDGIEWETFNGAQVAGVEHAVRIVIIDHPPAESPA